MKKQWQLGGDTNSSMSGQRPDATRQNG